MATRRRVTVPKVLVGAVLAVTGVGPLLADFVVPQTAGQHLRNPAWTPHAKFHDAQYIVMSGLTSAVGFRTLLHRGGDERAQLRQAAALGSMAWLGMWGALAFPGTAATDPEFDATTPRPLGLHPQLLLSLVLLGGLSAAVTLDSVDS